ncbi:uncharacterized protein AC631_03530 [Debaryomyces fabryi]|uniref:Uncharacterized protein n=1 Tax=Debaryomyces fabryi TaxID=58627 RepID=A0A0V1PWS8_9ASCO|nr:uncharacterized protein AC631_03530 [Debaryomyces fabryi]KSA00711.1 hypothetical protein AC631_03530 [Debaryomyces fabryi]CUM52099.1 unnamed protein product [Debaryomyces fabryi]
MITDLIFLGYLRDPFVYGSLTLALGFGTIYYFHTFSVWRNVRKQGIKCIHSKAKLFHTILGAFLIFLNIYVWLYLSSEYFATLTFLGLNGSRSPLTLSIIGLNYSEFNVPGYSFIEEKVQVESTEDFECKVVQFSDQMFASPAVPVEGNLRRVRNQAFELAKSEYPIAKNCFLDRDDESEEEILKKKWARFCGSSVWLSKYEVHFFVNRIVYAHESARSRPTISLIDVQIFDRDWKELTNFNITLADGTVLQYPGLVKIDIDQNPKHKLTVMGPEDPRVVLRKFVNEQGELEEEPVIIFNMRRTEISWKRAMHFYRPFHGNNTTRLSLRGLKPRFREKNWAPFFDDNDPDNIYFIYNFNPLRVIMCGLSDGVCDKVSGPDFIDSKADESKHVGALRGGTNLVPIPPHLLPNHLFFRRYWFGIARSHNSECGCLKEIYRPHAFIISKNLETDEFTLDYVSSLMDFNVIAEPWTENQAICKDGKNVLIPNSIAYWDHVLKSDSTVEHDFMGISFSEADRTNKIVHIKGFWHHILKALNSKDTGQGSQSIARIKEYYAGNNTELENELLGRCATSLAEQYCEDTAITQIWID